MTILTQNEALEKCGFVLSGGKWRKPLDENHVLFQINGRVGWSVDIEKEGSVKTEPAGRMKGTPVYDIIQAELTALDKMISRLEGEEEEKTVKDPIDNLKEFGFEINRGEGAKPAPQQIDYNEGLETVNLPVPTGVGIVRPAVSPAEAVAAWREFQDLKKAIISKSDLKNINGKDAIIKSGWRKFATFYNLTDQIVDEIRTEREDLVKGAFQWKIKVICTAPNGRKTEGVAICTSVEKKFVHPEHDCYATCHTRAKNRAISDMIAAGEVSAEELEA